MAMVCAISNQVPEQPVISPASGAIFEKRLVEKYISENGADPINGQPLTLEQLIEIKGQSIVKPRPPSATSIPVILKMLQDEWDSCMLQGFCLRQQLQTARQELSHALYEHDAACRVISRLPKEVAAGRKALARLKPQGAVPTHGQGEATSDGGETGEAVDKSGMAEEVIQKLQDKAAVLTAARKQRGKTVPERLVTADEMKNFKQLQSHTGVPGITCVDVHANDTRFVGNDKNVVVFNKESEQVVATLKGRHKRSVSAVYHPTEHATERDAMGSGRFAVLNSSWDSSYGRPHAYNAETKRILKDLDRVARMPSPVSHAPPSSTRSTMDGPAAGTAGKRDYSRAFPKTKVQPESNAIPRLATLESNSMYRPWNNSHSSRHGSRTGHRTRSHIGSTAPSGMVSSGPVFRFAKPFTVSTKNVGEIENDQIFHFRGITGTSNDGPSAIAHRFGRGQKVRAKNLPSHRTRSCIDGNSR